MANKIFPLMSYSRFLTEYEWVTMLEKPLIHGETFIHISIPFSHSAYLREETLN